MKEPEKMKFSHTLVICACLLLGGCGKTEVAEQPAPAPISAAPISAAPAPAPAANRDPRLEFNKLVQFLGTKTPRVYWLNTGIEGTALNPKNVKQDGNYNWREPSRDGTSYQSIDMRVTNHNFDGGQNIGTITWTVTNDLQTWDQSAYDFARNLNEKSRRLGTDPKDLLNPTDQATLRIKDTDAYKATLYFSNGWSLQKIESSSDSSSFKISNDNRVKLFFQEAMKVSLK